MLTNMLLILLALIVYMTVVWLIGRRRDRLDTVDVAWGIGYVLVAWLSEAMQSTSRSLLLAILVSIWGLRLSGHIYWRGRGKSDDRRYRELTQRWQGPIWRRAYISVFLLQGILVWLISLPILLASGRTVLTTAWIPVAGVIIWLGGFMCETVADYQLGRFMRQADHPKVLQTGLWRYSRHPNYFGELVQWWAFGLIAVSANYGWIGFLGPLILTIFIVFISGLPPIERRHASNPAYRDYIRRTSPLILWPPRTLDNSG